MLISGPFQKSKKSSIVLKTPFGKKLSAANHQKTEYVNPTNKKEPLVLTKINFGKCLPNNEGFTFGMTQLEKVRPSTKIKY